jgi:hypothetical protein
VTAVHFYGAQKRFVLGNGRCLSIPGGAGDSQVGHLPSQVPIRITAGKRVRDEHGPKMSHKNLKHPPLKAKKMGKAEDDRESAFGQAAVG